jgi:hypothetical protein
MRAVDIENDRIFVSIAAYRDYEARNTINDLFAKAKNRDRIFVGILSQVDPRSDLNLLIGQRRNVREMVIDAREADGCTWARSLILTKMRKDEEFVLQIDAHSRFDQNWDTQILAEYASLPNHDSVLTSYPPAFQLGEPLDTSPKHVFMKFRDIHSSGLPIFMADIGKKPMDVPKAPLTPALSAGCLFGPSNIFDRVPYDPYVYFFGEEQSYAIRLYTHGIDLYAPRQTFLYHLYYDPNKDKKNLHWNDYKEKNRDGTSRVKYILGMSDHFPSDNCKDLDKYGIGNVRSVAQWEAFSGFNLRTGDMAEIAKTGDYHKLLGN